MTKLHGRYVSVRRTSELLGVPERTVRHWCATGRLRTKPAREPGAPYRIIRSDVERMMKS